MNRFYVYHAYGVSGELLYVGKGSGERYKHCSSGVSSKKNLNRYYFQNGEGECITTSIVEYFDLPQRGDLVTVNGFTGEIIKAFGTEVEVLFGGDALHNCVEEHDLSNAVYDGKGWVLSYEN